MFHDMHCHLDYMANGEMVAASAREAGTLIFANTVTPEGWASATERFARFDNIIVGFGMHPWFVADAMPVDEPAPRKASSQRAEHKRLVDEGRQTQNGSAQRSAEKIAGTIALLEERNPGIIGEIGLDFGWRHAATSSEQVQMFSAIAEWAAREGDKLISLHSIKAARETLDILEQSGALSTCTCIFHWFSGSSDQLKRAIDAGCYFSCGPRMFATGKGREYVKAIPVKRLLLETDAPPQQGDRYSYAQLRCELENAAQSVAAIKGEGALEVIAETSARLLAR